MLTGADSLVCYFDIEYNPLDNSYLAVCDAYEEGYGSPINIFSLKLNSKGRPVGSPKQLTPKGTKYLCPVICFVPGIPVAPPNGKGNYLMAYSYLAPLLEADKAVIYTTFLEYDGDMTASVPRLVSAPLIDWKGFVGLESLPVKLIAMSDGGFMMTLRKSTGAFLMNSFLLRLGQFGQAIKQVPLCDYASTLVEFVQLSQRICVASWDRYETGYMECYNQLFRPTLKKVRKLFYPLDDDKAFITELVKLNDDPGGYQLASDGKNLLGRYISKKGKLGPNTEMLFDHLCLLYRMDADCLPESNRVFVAWVEKRDTSGVPRMGKTTSVSEVKGFVFDAK